MAPVLAFLQMSLEVILEIEDELDLLFNKHLLSN